MTPDDDSAPRPPPDALVRRDLDRRDGAVGRRVHRRAGRRTRGRSSCRERRRAADHLPRKRRILGVHCRPVVDRRRTLRQRNRRVPKGPRACGPRSKEDRHRGRERVSRSRVTTTAIISRRGPSPPFSSTTEAPFSSPHPRRSTRCEASASAPALERVRAVLPDPGTTERLTVARYRSRFSTSTTVTARRRSRTSDS